MNNKKKVSSENNKKDTTEKDSVYQNMIDDMGKLSDLKIIDEMNQRRF